MIPPRNDRQGAPNMDHFVKLTAAVAMLAALAACDRNAGSGNASNAVATNASANASAGGKDPAAAGGGNSSTAAAAPFTGQVTRDFLVGRWTDTNDCTSTLEFRADGSFVAATGQGLWVLDGERLTFQGQRSVTARVQAPDANTIMLIHDDGTVGRSTRCV